MTPHLETERLILRGWRQDDFDPIALFSANEATAKYTGGVMTRVEAWRDLAISIGHWTLRGYGIWAVEERRTHQFVGYAGIWHPLGWPEPELGWGLIAEAQGKGFAFEAVSKARDHAASAWGFVRLISFIAPANLPSQRLAERLGARQEGEFELDGERALAFRHPAPAQDRRLGQAFQRDPTSHESVGSRPKA